MRANYEFGPFRLDVDASILFRDGVPVPLGRRAVALLSTLIERAGAPVSKEALIDAAWPGTVVEESNLSVQIAAVRRILGAESWIETLPRRGYRYVGPAVVPVEQGAGHDPTSPAKSELSRPIGAAEPPAADSGSSAPPRLSIVVLPFVNLSSDIEQDYLADAITEDLTTDLSRIPGSFVVATKTALTFKGKAQDVREIGRFLGVRYALEGSIRRLGKQIRVNAQLIDTGRGAHLWADRFDGDMSDLTRLQDEVTTRLARLLDVELAAVESRRAQRERPDDPDVVDLVMRGRAALNKPISLENLREARLLFERALLIDGDDFGALVGLAYALWFIILDRYTTSRTSDLERAQEVAAKALSLRPNEAHAYFVWGLVMQLQKKHAETATAFEACIALNRNFASAYASLGLEKQYLGKGEETMGLVEQAMRLSPRDPNLGLWMAAIGYASLFLAQDEEAITWLQRSIMIMPGSAGTYLALASAHAHRGRMDEARAVIDAHNKIAKMTISALRADNQSDNPVFLARRERFLEGLRLAGLPE